VRREDGYLPIEDHGLIGDGTTAALVGRDGTITWLWVPRFDSPPIFCALLDTARGGAFEVTHADLVVNRLTVSQIQRAVANHNAVNVRLFERAEDHPEHG